MSTYSLVAMQNWYKLACTSHNTHYKFLLPEKLMNRNSRFLVVVGTNEIDTLFFSTGKRTWRSSHSSYLCYNVIQGLNVIGTNLGHNPDVLN